MHENKIFFFKISKLDFTKGHCSNVELQPGSTFKSNFTVGNELGRGRFGIVFKATHVETGEIFAAKFVKCRKKEDLQKVKDEISIMNLLDHEKLLQLALAFENPRETILVMEYIGGGELFEKVVADDFTLTEKDCILVSNNDFITTFLPLSWYVEK